MKISSDFSELLRIFNEDGVRYLVVGGYAVMRYTEPRYTKDLDLWVDPTRANARRVHQALRRFGAPLASVTVEDFTREEMVFQIGVAPVRVDILMHVLGVTFGRAWKNRVEVHFGGEPAHMISREDLIICKRSTNRPQDRIDLKNLLAPRPPGRRRQPPTR
jgi:predicted nucleotidyltransferase